MSALTVSFLSAAINSVHTGPAIVSAMLTTFQMEVEAGYKDIVGHASIPSLKQDPAYTASYRKFRRFHGLSAMMVTLSLLANCVHLYYIAMNCAPL